MLQRPWKCPRYVLHYAGRLLADFLADINASRCRTSDAAPSICTFFSDLRLWTGDDGKERPNWARLCVHAEGKNNQQRRTRASGNLLAPRYPPVACRASLRQRQFAAMTSVKLRCNSPSLISPDSLQILGGLVVLAM